MLRKRKVATLAGRLLAVMAMVPAAAAAADVPESWRGHYRPVWGPAYVNGVPVSYGYGLCYRSELLSTPWGPRWRLVNHCY